METECPLAPRLRPLDLSEELEDPGSIVPCSPVLLSPRPGTSLLFPTSKVPVSTLAGKGSGGVGLFSRPLSATVFSTKPKAESSAAPSVFPQALKPVAFSAESLPATPAPVAESSLFGGASKPKAPAAASSVASAASLPASPVLPKPAPAVQSTAAPVVAPFNMWAAPASAAPSSPLPTVGQRPSASRLASQPELNHLDRHQGVFKAQPNMIHTGMMTGVANRSSPFSKAWLLWTVFLVLFFAVSAGMALELFPSQVVDLLSRNGVCALLSNKKLHDQCVRLALEHDTL